ncbi:redoxin family protein [Phaeodactylibacter xiamenensis]|uniref:redoxin family protein n=1 Tax=Phaeodactylibacter xiamenensis TaxID=1524460 RepID=UPI0024A7D5A1|nr:redoxin family protein [Phaeodactylibacter xiamenensis]
MRTYLLATCLFLFSYPVLLAQPAPDFNITDSQGNSHQLYADYLDQGKTVVLKLFFTSCPPCNAIASATEQLNQEWGGGSNDVVFISLSILGNDTDNQVNNYKANHGITYPGASPAGGSLAATAPYQNGTYGFFLGTPTFVVIAPDGTVDYDPRGPNQSATLMEVDAAIEATGAQRPLVSLANNGSAVDPQNDGVAGMSLEITELDSIVAQTNSTGSYSFNLQVMPGQSYTLRATKDINPTNGVSTLDLILLSQHILGVQPITDPERLLAADANRSGGVSLLDQIRIRKLILSIDSDFGEQPSWIVIPADYDFQNPEDPFDEVYNGNLNQAILTPGSLQSLQWKAIKVGDLNLDANPRD